MKSVCLALVLCLCASAASACDQAFSAFRGQCLQGYAAPIQQFGYVQPFVGGYVQPFVQPFAFQQFGYGQAFVAQPFAFGHRRAFVVRNRGVFGRPLLVPRVRSFRF